MTTNEFILLLSALAGLISAIANLIRAWRHPP